MLAMLGYQLPMPTPLTSIATSPAASLLLGRPLVTGYDSDVVVQFAVPLLAIAGFTWAARARGQGLLLGLVRGLAVAAAALLLMVNVGWQSPGLWLPGAPVLAATALAVFGARRVSWDLPGLVAATVFAVGTAATHYGFPFGGLAHGGARAAPVLYGALAGAAVLGLMLWRGVIWNGAPRMGAVVAAGALGFSTLSVSGYLEMNRFAYGCESPAAEDCPWQEPGIDWLTRGLDDVFSIYALRFDPARDQVVVAERSRQCVGDYTVRLRFFDASSGAEEAMLEIPDCDRVDVLEPEGPDHLLVACVSQVIRVDLNTRTPVTDRWDPYADFEGEGLAPWPAPGEGYLFSTIDKNMLVHLDPETLTEVGRMWLGDGIHVSIRLYDLSWIEPGMVLMTGASTIEVFDADLKLRARRNAPGLNVFGGIDQEQRRFYVADATRRQLEVWSLPDLQPLDVKVIDPGPYNVHVAPDEGLVATSHFFTETVAFHALDDLEPRGSVWVGPKPRAVAIRPGTRTVWGSSSCGLFRFDLDLAARP